MDTIKPVSNATGELPPVRTARISTVGSKAAAGQEAEAAAATEETASRPTLTELEKAVATLDEVGRSVGSPALEFALDDDAGVVVITVRNRNTGEVIRQLPAEEALAAAANAATGDLPVLVELRA